MRRGFLLSLVLAPALAGCDLLAPDYCVDAGGYPGPVDNVYFVFYREDVPVQPTTDRLAERHRFTPSAVYGGLRGFSAPLSRSAYEGLRCESVVDAMGPNGLVVVD